MLDGSGRAPARHSRPLEELGQLLRARDRRADGPSRRGYPVPKRGALSILSLPGGPAGLCSLYAHYGGALPWAAVVAPARQLALGGFALSSRTVTAWRQGVREVLRDAQLEPQAEADFRAQFDIELEEGDKVVNRELAETLDGFAVGGCPWFYGPAGPLESALKYAVANGALFALEPGGQLNLSKKEWEATWDLHPDTRRIVAGNRTYLLTAPAGGSQAGAAGEILEELVRSGAKPVGNATMALAAHVAAKRKVYRLRAERGPSSMATRLRGGGLQAEDGEELGSQAEELDDGEEYEENDGGEQSDYNDDSESDDRTDRAKFEAKMSKNANSFWKTWLTKKAKRVSADKRKAKLDERKAQKEARMLERRSAMRARAHEAAAATLKREGGRRLLQSPSGNEPMGADTEGLVVADVSGMVVALTQSLGNMFGSGVCDPAGGFCLHGRGYGFSLNSSASHPYGPGKRPAHTLSPYLVQESGTAGWVMGVAAKGGDRVPYALTQMLWPYLFAEQAPSLGDLARFIARPRFRDVAQGSPTPWVPTGFTVGGDGREKLELEPCIDDRCWTEGVASQVGGLQVVEPQSTEYEDSGFGILHAVAVRRVMGLRVQGGPLEFFAATDSTRKPGKATVMSIERARTAFTAEELEIKSVLKKLMHSQLVVPALNEDQKRRRRTVFTAGTVSCRPDTWSTQKWAIYCIKSKPRSLTRYQVQTGVLLGVGFENRHNAIENSFPVSSIPQMSPQIFHVAILEDKGAWIEYLTGLGLDEFLPTTIRDDSFRAALRVSQGKRRERLEKALKVVGLSFPFVIKFADTTWGTGVVVVKDTDELQEQWLALQDGSESRFVLQEALEGPEEVTVNFAALYGQLVWTDAVIFRFDDLLFVKSYKRDKQRAWAKENGGGRRVSKQISSMAKQPEVAQQLVQQVVERARLHGIGCVQFKTFTGRDGTLRAKLIEVNARPCKSMLLDKSFPAVVNTWLAAYHYWQHTKASVHGQT